MRLKFYVLMTYLTMLASAMAQNYAPSDVCRRINNFNSSAANECLQLINHNQFDQNVTNLAYKMADHQNTVSAMDLLQNCANHYVQFEAANVCSRIADSYPTNAVKCMSNVMDGTYFIIATDLAYKMANKQNIISSIDVLKLTKNAYLHTGATNVCNRMADSYPTEATKCINIIVNKDFYNGTESICYDMANNQNINSALSCLTNNAMPHQTNPYPTPYPTPTPYPPVPREFYISLDQYSNLLKEIRYAQRMISFGKIDQVSQSLNDMANIMSVISQQSRPISLRVVPLK